MRYGESEFIVLSSKEIVLTEANSSSQNQQPFPFLDDLQQKKEITTALGHLTIQNKGNDAIIYKIRGNRPQNYRLAHSCAVVKPGSFITAHIRIIDCSLYAQNDLFQLKYIFLSSKLQDQAEQVESEQLQQFWQILEKQQSSLSIYQNILPVRIIKQNQQTNIPMMSSLQSKIQNSNGILRERLPSAISRQENSSIQNVNYASNNVNGFNSVISGVVNRKDRNKQMEQLSEQTSFTKSTYTQGFSPVPLQTDYKQQYEKLVVKVDEQDKQLFVLNQDRKKLESEWKILNVKQEQLKSSELDVAKRKSINGINLSSAVLIAIISLIFGIYLGN